MKPHFTIHYKKGSETLHASCSISKTYAEILALFHRYMQVNSGIKKDEYQVTAVETGFKHSPVFGAAGVSHPIVEEDFLSKTPDMSGYGKVNIKFI